MASRSSAGKGESRTKTEDEALLTIPKTARHTTIPRAMKSKSDDPGWLVSNTKSPVIIEDIQVSQCPVKSHESLRVTHESGTRADEKFVGRGL